MKKGKWKVVALLTGVVLLLSPAVSVKAETQASEAVETEASQTIVRDGEVYELYKVETVPAVETIALEEGDGLRTVRQGTIYYYRSEGSARVTNISHGDFTNDTYSEDGTLIATLRQKTEWYYNSNLNDAPELLDEDTFVTYQHPHAAITIEGAKTSVPTMQKVATTIHEVFYVVMYKGIVYEEEIYTICDAYGLVR